MGGIHRIKRQLSKKVILADTKISFNGCKILLVVPEGKLPGDLVKGFQVMMAGLTARSRRVSLSDFYRMQFKILEKVESGKGILN